MGLGIESKKIACIKWRIFEIKERWQVGHKRNMKFEYSFVGKMKIEARNIKIRVAEGCACI